MLGDTQGPSERFHRIRPSCLLGNKGLGFRVEGSGFRVEGSGFRVEGSGFRFGKE